LLEQRLPLVFLFWLFFIDCEVFSLLIFQLQLFSYWEMVDLSLALLYLGSDCSCFFTLLDTSSCDSSSIILHSEYASDIHAISFLLYNVTFIHFLLLGFTFTVVIIAVISLLLQRNLYVKRQFVFEQNNSNLFNNLYLAS
jgi:hypothetical protein